MICVTVFGVVFGVVWQAGSAMREAARRIEESQRLKWIALAMHNYHAVYQSFPEAVVIDTEKQPFRSWRVSVVPFIESSNLFTQYQLQQAWNSPANDALCRFEFRLYSSPRATNKDKFCTNIFMPIGAGTVGEMPVSLDDITDDHATTILLLCHLKSDVHWHEPRDIHISEFTRAPGDPNRILFRGELFKGAHAAMVDGRVHWLPADLKYDTLMAMLTIAGGESVDSGEFAR